MLISQSKYVVYSGYDDLMHTKTGMTLVKRCVRAGNKRSRKYTMAQYREKLLPHIIREDQKQAHAKTRGMA